jgi:branched-chain amino acid transport system ATP-binding protein
LRRQTAQLVGLVERAYAAFPRLREKRRWRATALSGGEAKMLTLAKEQVTEPTLLLVDEPSAGLAPRIAQQVYTQLFHALVTGVTILLVDQNITKAVEISDYLYMLEMGQIRREGLRQAFATRLRELVRDALLGV